MRPAMIAGMSWVNAAALILIPSAARSALTSLMTSVMLIPAGFNSSVATDGAPPNVSGYLNAAAE